MTEEELLQVIEQAAAEGWTELDLGGNQLTNLKTLTLNFSLISNFPESINKLIKLGKLNLRENLVPN
ncbi:Miro domain-containing protein [Calothrix parasitica NIES-267]|uniref:Miro domain-containing protein n=1 Tax=Calothrix parasitica NIES-267 TaxID=1973488 RepID=A0A1Z4LPU2_9CYAN|nr:Miro domain-containing protein [Calothrix parasitica NIES-267]